MLEQIRKYGWLAVEAGVLVIVLCVLLNIILGRESGAFIATVAGNTTAFLQAVPPGSFLGVILLLFIYWFVRTRV